MIGLVAEHEGVQFVVEKSKIKSHHTGETCQGAQAIWVTFNVPPLPQLSIVLDFAGL